MKCEPSTFERSQSDKPSNLRGGSTVQYGDDPPLSRTEMRLAEIDRIARSLFPGLELGPIKSGSNRPGRSIWTLVSPSTSIGGSKKPPPHALLSSPSRASRD
ncbi:hypothetical protein CDAR_423091 [Caerostris darwini]|uniref:Uncharacterized protein n=1 Tax=Caerostris darwini TaxID=1538125 RepID=A0AAV4TGG4_9ARAC|nr:hypothetical protein CDAR_423091 [Caerostris darwini]